MKKYFLPIVFLLFVLFSSLAIHYAIADKEPLTASISTSPQYGSARLAGDIEVKIDKPDASLNNTGGIISNNWGILVMGLLSFAEVIVRVTPTEKDNSILKIISTFLNAIIPNKKKGGGLF